MEHTILILILPFLSFLILGLAGMRMKNGLAGTIGTVSLAGVTIPEKTMDALCFLILRNIVAPGNLKGYLLKQ